MNVHIAVDAQGATNAPVQGLVNSLIRRRRAQFGFTLIVAAVVPYVVRSITLPGAALDPPNLNAFLANVCAITFAVWIRLSIAPYPGIRSSNFIVPTILAAHGLLLAFFLMARLPYDRLALLSGFSIHMLARYMLYFAVDRRARPSIAIVPFGEAGRLQTIGGVRWLIASSPRAENVRCDALVADFSAELPDDWKAFLADAALDGRVVYQHKQLSESLTGRVELAHLSENNFGSLVPARAWFHLKSLVDFVAALLVVPFAIPIFLIAALAIWFEDRGPVLFRQVRVGHAGKRFTVYKFRTMRPLFMDNAVRAAMTTVEDQRVTRVGRTLRRWRIDEVPQIINILKFEMSWIGPRPEADVLSQIYTSELPFYRYRHVVKPGISGWAQVNQGHVAEVEQVHRKLHYDFYYIKYFSPWLDILIVFRTMKTVLTGFGAK